MKSTLVASLCSSAFVAALVFLFVPKSPASAVQPAKPKAAAAVEYKVVQIAFTPGIIAAEPREFNRKFQGLAKDGWRYVDTIYDHPTARIGVAYVLFQRTKR